MNEDTKPAKVGWTRGIGLRSTLFALYILASAIGFFYVDAYYGSDNLCSQGDASDVDCGEVYK